MWSWGSKASWLLSHRGEKFEICSLQVWANDLAVRLASAVRGGVLRMAKFPPVTTEPSSGLQVSFRNDAEWIQKTRRGR